MRPDQRPEINERLPEEHIYYRAEAQYSRVFHRRPAGESCLSKLPTERTLCRPSPAPGCSRDGRRERQRWLRHWTPPLLLQSPPDPETGPVTGHAGGTVGPPEFSDQWLHHCDRSVPPRQLNAIFQDLCVSLVGDTAALVATDGLRVGL